MIPVLYSATVWLEWQYDYSATVPSQFYGAKVLRLQFYGPNVRVPDTTEPRTWLIRQSASLLPPFAAVMSSSPPPPFVKLGHTVLPPQYQYQYLLIVITPSDLPLPSGFCHPQFPLRSLISPSPTSQSSLLLLLLPQLLAERKRLSDQFYYYHYNNQWHEEKIQWVL